MRKNMQHLSLWNYVLSLSIVILLRCLFNLSKQTWPPVSSSVAPSINVTGYGCHTLPSALKSLTQELSCPIPRCFSLNDPDFLFTSPFVPFPSQCCSLFPALCSLSFFTRHVPAQPGHVHFELFQMSLSLLLPFELQ